MSPDAAKDSALSLHNPKLGRRLNICQLLSPLEQGDTIPAGMYDAMAPTIMTGLAFNRLSASAV